MELAVHRMLSLTDLTFKSRGPKLVAMFLFATDS